ncbi:MAG TPA: hypothetical protein VJZ71_06580 [Phycisphaerae bacterium]|nr:hypothetical protein [Phycisphaerae bacterium]
MPAERNAFKVGLVTIVTGVAFFVILIWISQTVGGDLQRIAVRFKSAPSMPSLMEGSGVLVGGQKVGNVVSAELRSEEVADADKGSTHTQYYVYVEADLRADLKLKSDVKAIAEGPPLGGDGILKIDLGTAATAWDTARVIEGAEPAGFAAILASLQGEFNAGDPKSLLGQIKGQLDPNSELSLMAKLLKSVSDVNAMTAALNRQLTSEEKATLMAKLQGIMDNVNGATGALRAEMESQKPDVLLGKIHQAMDSMNGGLTTIARVLTTNEGAINQSMENVQQTTANIARETDATKPESLMADFKQAGDKLNQTLADLNTVTGTTREVMVLNRENISRMLLNFKESSDHLKNGMKYVLHHPWLLLNEPKVQNLRQQAIADAARSFTDAAARIDDAASQLRVLSDLHGGKIPGDSPELAKIEADLRSTQAKYQQAEAQLWKELNVK